MSHPWNMYPDFKHISSFRIGKSNDYVFVRIISNRKLVLFIFTSSLVIKISCLFVSLMLHSLRRAVQQSPHCFNLRGLCHKIKSLIIQRADFFLIYIRDVFVPFSQNTCALTSAKSSLHWWSVTIIAMLISVINILTHFSFLLFTHPLCFCVAVSLFH